ncbi:MAG: FeoB-associated Cys-rich membrane protein [Opitutales bacterium]|nr:FeoB-associated Cys-rich membrane protein [Opitutales bacterium]
MERGLTIVVALLAAVGILIVTKKLNKGRNSQCSSCSGGCCSCSKGKEPKKVKTWAAKDE